MGLTIHHELRSDATSPEHARQRVEQLRQAALDLAMLEVGEAYCFVVPIRVFAFSTLPSELHDAPRRARTTGGLGGR